ncbi:beta-amylase 1, chloroplastic [Trifolium repens]|nr:beta-amylase 1, chloroplastic [Trifolium repens]
MALSITPQIRSLVGTPVPESTTGEPTASLSAAAVWKTPAANLRVKASRSEAVTDGLSPPMSPCRSPVLGGIRPDLNAACQAFTMEEVKVEHVAGSEFRKPIPGFYHLLR